MSSRANTWRDSPPVLVWCMVVVVGCVATGTLLPFSFERGPAGADQLFGLSQLGWHRSSLSDVLTNVCVYLPVGGLFALLFRARGMNPAARSDFARVLFACGLAVLMSVGLEWMQTMMPFRVASWVDVCMNGLGALAGATLATSARFADPMCRRLLRALRLQPFSTAAGVVTVGLVLYHLMPFDFVTSSASLWQSLRQSRALPLQRAMGPETWVACAGYAGQFAVLGFLGVLGYCRRGWSLGDSVKRTLTHVSVLALLIEVLQVLVVSHAFDVVDGMAGAAGGLVGTAVAAWLVAARIQPSWRGVLGVVLAGQVAYLWVLSAAPFDLAWGHVDPSRTISLPFWGHFMRPFGVAMAELLETAVTFALLGAVVWTLLVGWPRRLRMVGVLLVVVGVSSACEVLQMLTASRYADVTDPLVAVCVAVAVVLLAPPVEWARRTGAVAPAPADG
ncbi:MAG: VanZ family protein [Phycisphaerae bacterium]